MRELSKMTDTFSKAVVGFERIQEVEIIRQCLICHVLAKPPVLRAGLNLNMSIFAIPETNLF